jgi:preprotein translocase subunit SecG
MRVRGPERSSILLLGRSTVIIGAIVITVLSFGLGYFWGYKESDVSQTEDEPPEFPQETMPQKPSGMQNFVTTK